MLVIQVPIRDALGLAVLYAVTQGLTLWLIVVLCRLDVAYWRETSDQWQGRAECLAYQVEMYRTLMESAT